MESDPVFPRLEVLRHLHGTTIITAAEIMNSQLGIPTTHSPQKWTSLQSQNPSPMIEYMKKNQNRSPNPNPDVGLVVIYPHQAHGHAVTPTTHMHGNPSVISRPPHHKEATEDTITRFLSPLPKPENQIQMVHPDPIIITTTVLAPDPQVSNSKSSYLMCLTQSQLQPPPRFQTQQCTCPHHHDQTPVTDTI